MTLQPYASLPNASRGRLMAEEEARNRSVFQRDRDRIIHSGAFRKLEYKTQVFVNHEGDYYRTRLTHTIEVSQIARTIARSLGLNEDLTEAVALAHDLGHPPFGHAGEDALNEMMKNVGGFNHNVQALRILTSLERRYVAFDGLNLTWETLEGVIKHNGPLKKPYGRTVSAYLKQHDLDVHSFPSLEAQVAALADDIAYNNHDIDDGLRAQMFDVRDLLDVPFVGAVFGRILKANPDASPSQLAHEATRRLMDAMIQDLLDTTRSNLKKQAPRSVDDVRAARRPLVCFSPQQEQYNRGVKKFLQEHLYRHYKVNRMTSKARRIVRDLYGAYSAEPECLPTDWAARHRQAAKVDKPAIIADYIAGMTDRYAIKEHRRLFDVYQKND